VLLPIYTEAHEGKVGMAALAIAGICLTTHIFVASDTKRAHERIASESARIIQAYYDSVATHDSLVAAQTGEYPAPFDETLRRFDSLYSDPDVSVQEIRERLLDGSLMPAGESVKKRTLEIIRESLVYQLGLVANDFSLLSLFTHMFVHGSWLHLLGNLWFFYICGVTMERYWGLWKFVASYLGCGACAALSFMGIASLSGANIDNTPLIGASGAISAAMGAFVVTHRRSKVRMFWTYGLRGGTFDIGVPWYFAFWLTTQVFYAFMTLHKGSGVAYTAHITGFVFGFILGKVLKSSDEAALLVAPSKVKRPVYVGAEGVSDSDSEPATTDAVRMVRPVTASTGPVDQVLQQVLQTRGHEKPRVVAPVSVADAWRAFDRGDYQQASAMLVTSFDRLISSGVESHKATIAETMNRILRDHEKLRIEPQVLYQWAKHLAAMQLPKHASSLFEVTAAKSPAQHLQFNSLLQAAAIRIALGDDLQRARQNLEYIIKNDSAGVYAYQAKQQLDAMGSAGTGTVGLRDIVFGDNTP
jgi:membrane associated rhomboid family serine protease